MKTLKLPNNTTSFLLRDIKCHTKIQSILKSHEKTSSSKINFLKSQALQSGACKKRIDKTEQMVWSQVSFKILAVHFGSSVLCKSNWDKISRSLAKKFNIWNRVQLSMR